MLRINLAAGIVRVPVKQLTERIGIDTLRFFCLQRAKCRTQRTEVQPDIVGICQSRSMPFTNCTISALTCSGLSPLEKWEAFSMMCNGYPVAFDQS